MYGDIAEPHDVGLLDLWVPLAKFRGQPGGSLADHGQLLQHSTLAQLVLEEILVANAGDEPSYSIRRFQNIK